MTRQKTDPLLALVQGFFESYLVRTRGASAHTVRAYRDTLRLLFTFVAERLKRDVSELALDDIQAEAVLAFLDHAESGRRNSATTRNCRLAAIRSFAQHLFRNDLTRAEQYGRILAIPNKRHTRPVVSYLEPEEARAVIAATDPGSPQGVRDHALLLFLYNTGARVSEALGVHPRQLQLDRPRQVRLHGKGGRDRICPLWPETAAALRQMLTRSALASPDDVIFRNARGAALTRDGVAYLIEKYTRRAAQKTPELRSRHVTPHVFRHSCAVALLQAGVDLTAIRDYLGHATVATTNLYTTTNLKTKREVLDAFWRRAGLEKRPRRQWHPSPKLLAYLNSL